MNKKVYSISTIGDSLTEGGGRGTIIGSKFSMPNMYQFWTYNWLMSKGILCEIRNHGSSGQVTSEICGRFDEAIPADFIVMMSGTNDAGRFSGDAPDIEKKIAEDIIVWHKKVIPEVIDAQRAKGWADPIILVNSVPPISSLETMSKYMHKTILHINGRLEEFVANCGIPKVYFCDVHKAMRGDDLYMRPGLYIPDGMHFSIAGNKACGECVAGKIYEIIVRRER